MNVALLGNPNCGKTTLFNALTGMNAKIGNWPGVTIEKRIGIIKGTSNKIIDLPGIYSLSPYSLEEEITRKYILEEKPDIIINIIDSTCLERSLYLTTQVLELDCKIIIALNMVDILEKKGMEIDIKKLEQNLGTKVIKVSALKKTGIQELIQELSLKEPRNDLYIYDIEFETAIKKIENELPNTVTNKRFLAVKLLENDEKLKDYNNLKIVQIINEYVKYYNMDLDEEIATKRYAFIENIKKKVVKIGRKKETVSDKIDKIFLNKYLAFPIFLIIMFLVYYLSVGIIGKWSIESTISLINWFKQFLEFFLINIGTSKWIVSLIVDGIISGVGAVIIFIPQLIILFICIAILETTGYMSRVSLLFDNIFRKIGLSGKSIIPFIIGTGCSVPAISGTKIIENKQERDLTILLTPFIPCSAKLPIIVLFSSYFFEKNTALICVSFYVLSILIIVLSAMLLKKVYFNKIINTYILELPEYKMPNSKYIAKDVLEKTVSFIKRAGSVILICSIVVWFLLSFSLTLEYGVVVEKSILAFIGKIFSKFFYPMIGNNSWEIAVSAIQGLVAKEQVVSSMSVIAGFVNNENEIFNSPNFMFFTKSSAYAFVVFNLFSAPCFGAIIAMKKEFGEIKKMIKAVTFQIAFAWALSVIIYQIGNRVETKVLNIGDLIVVTILLTILVIIFTKKNKGEECRKCPYCNACQK